MKHFKIGVTFVLALLLLTFCSCSASDTSQPSDSQDGADNSTADASEHTSKVNDYESTPIEDDSETEHVHAFTDAACTEEGVCECGETIPPLGHDFADADCVNPSTCTICGETEGDAFGHDYAGTNCTEDGVCTRCGETEAAFGHDFAEADCVTPSTCTICGETEGNALGHDYAGVTCTESGKCTRCGEKLPALGHNFAEATCSSPSNCKRCGITTGNALGHSYSGGKCVRCGDTNGPLSPEEAKLFRNKLSDEENAEALAVARAIVKQIDAALPNGSDIERIGMAAGLVSDEYYKGVHVESGIYYSQAYGVFVKRESSCAGCTRALGLVLSCMGYNWTHINENQWTHQWLTVDVNGETIWADGQVGWYGTGSHPLG